MHMSSMLYASSIHSRKKMSRVLVAKKSTTVSEKSASSAEKGIIAIENVLLRQKKYIIFSYDKYSNINFEGFFE